MVWASSCCCTCSAVFVPQPVSRETAITNAASREIRRCNVLLLTKSFSSQLLGSWRFPAKLLWPTCRTSLPARVCAVKTAHGKDAANILRVSCFVLSLYRERAENDRNIKIFYYCHEGFSMDFHVFIHKNHACPISLHRRTWRAENCGGSLRYCTPRMASVVILYCSVTRANHSPEPSSVPARSTSVSS